jgi:hypothetical protein
MLAATVAEPFESILYERPLSDLPDSQVERA